MRQLRAAWPHAPFFCDLGCGYVVYEAFASLNHLTVVDWDKSDELAFRIPTLELRRYVAESYRVIRALGKKAGMSRSEIASRMARFDTVLEAGCGKWSA